MYALPCLHMHVYILTKQTYVNTRFPLCPTAGKVNQVDERKCNPRAGAAFLCIRDLSLPLQGWGVLNHTTPSSIKAAFVLFFWYLWLQRTGLIHLNNIPTDANIWKWSTAQILCRAQLWQGGHSQLVF